MKMNRLTKIIAVLLVIAMLPLGLLACGGTTGKVTERLVEMMVGDGGKLKNDEESVSADYLTKLDEEVTYLQTYFTKEGNWDEQWVEKGSTVEATHYQNLYKFATAWATKGSEFYHSGKLMSQIKDGLEFGVGEANYIGGSLAETWTERCDEAEYLVRTLLILRENSKLSKNKTEEYLAEIIGNFAIPTGSGVTLARTSYIIVASAALTGDELKLQSAITSLAKLAANVNTGSGLYADGSFVADTKVAAAGSYGILAFSEMVEIAYAVQGEAMDFASELAVPQYLYNWAVGSIMPSLFNGRAFASGAASYLDDAEVLGGRAVSSMLALAKYFDEMDGEEYANMAKELRSTVKGYALAESADFNAYLTTFGMKEYVDIDKDDKIEAKTVTGAHAFTVNDRLNILGTKYSASLSVSSFRTAKYETRINHFAKDEEEEAITAVNGRGWYTAEGMLMIYTADYNPGENYWKYVKATRLPGTTVDSRDRTEGVSDGYTGMNYQAGSAVSGTFAVSAYNFVNNNSELTSVGLVAKKSWFFLDGEIVALGAGINNPGDTFAKDGYSIETVIENVYVGNHTSVITNPASGDHILAKDKVEAAPDAFYILGYGGIYVPSDKNDTLKYTLNQTDGGNFVEVWLDHSAYKCEKEGSVGHTCNCTPELDEATGAYVCRLDHRHACEITEPIPEVVDKSYEYVIVPSTAVENMDQFFAYAQTPGYKVLSNTVSVQAVADDSSKVEQYVFWEAATCASDKRTVTTDFACNIIIEETDTQLKVTVADITQTASATPGTINIGSGSAAAGEAAGLTFAGGVITVDRNVAASGQSLTIVINK